MAINLWRYVLYLTICKLRRMSRLARFGACVPGFFVGLVLLVILVSCVVFLCSLSSFPVLYFCVLWLRSLCCISVFFGFVPCLLTNIATYILGFFILVQFKQEFVSFIKDRYGIWNNNIFFANFCNSGHINTSRLSFFPLLD